MKKISQSNYNVLQEQILKFMIRRGWKEKIAKRGSFEQSLLEHSANCLDVMLTLMPTLKMNLKLSEEEEQALILGISIHDVAKERDEWQAYVQGKGEYVSHVIPEYTATAVRELTDWLGFDNHIDAQATADLHMRSVQTAARILAATQDAGPRVMLLQRIVDAVDSIASANGLLAAYDVLALGPLGKHFHITHHIVQVRGVSTTLLHQAAQTAFEQQSWTPLLFYPTGTLYVCPGAEEPKTVTAERVQTELIDALGILLEGSLDTIPNIAVGKNITASFFSTPELFEYRALRAYLQVASGRVSRKKAKGITDSNVVKYFNLRRLIDTSGDYTLARKSYFTSPSKLDEVIPDKYQSLLVSDLSEISDTEGWSIRNRIAAASPEIAVFKVFKYIAATISEEVTEAMQEPYEELFGAGSYGALTSTSNSMPALDIAFTVDFFWQLSLRKLAGFLEKPALDMKGTVASLEQKRRLRLLIDTLTKIGEIGFAAMERPPTVDNFAQEVATVLIDDLIAPTSTITDVGAYAKRQLAYYKQAKHNIRTEREVGHICPICNHPFEQAKMAKADYLDKPTGFTGRKFAYAGEGLAICQACYYERLLRQIVLGRKAYDLIVLMPRMSIGRYGGKVLMDKLSELEGYIKSIATADTTDPDETLRLDMARFVTPQRALAADFNQMSAKDMIALFTYRTKEDTVKKNLKKVVKKVQSIFGDNLEAVNDFWKRDFSDWMEVARAITYKKVDDDIAQSIREDVYGLRSPIEFVAQTPNLVLAPSSNPRVSDSSALVDSKADSDAKAALKQMLTTIILALGLDCSVAVLRDKESLDALILESNGVAYVPPLSSVRGLVTNSRSKADQQRLSPTWLSQSETARWLRALASAILLANKADYPQRNDLYQILTARSKGALLRRIEQKGDNMYTQDWQQLEAIGEVLS